MKQRKPEPHVRLTFICALLVFIVKLSCFAQQEKIAFEKYGVEEGLPEEVATSFIQDKQGFIWIGTQNGLVKFDGYKMKVFRASKNDPNTIGPRNLLGGLLLASDGQIWIGGILFHGGLASYDPVNEKFTNYITSVKDSTKVPYPNCYPLFEDITKNIWFSSISEGNEAIFLCKINPKTKQVSRYPFKVGPKSNDIVLNFQMAESKRDSSIWLRTAKYDIVRYNRKRDKFEPQFKKGDIIPGTTLRDSIIDLINPGLSGLIPLANNQHMFLWDPLTRKVTDTYSFPAHDSIAAGASFEDQHGNFWVSSHDNLTRINRGKSQRDDFKFGTGLLSFIIPGDVMQIIPYYHNFNFILFQITSTDKQGHRYQFTLRYDFKSETFELFDGQFNDAENQFIINARTRKFLVDKTGLLWVGTRPNLFKQSPKTRQLAHYKHDPADIHSLVTDSISVIFEDSTERLWVGTRQGISLKMDNDKFMNLTAFDERKNNIKIDEVIDIIEDSYHQIWMGSTKGVFRWSASKNAFQKLKINGNEDNVIINLTEDDKGRIWISEWNKGVYVLDALKGTVIKRFEAKNKDSHSLTSVTIHQIFKDSKNQIWLGDPRDNEYGLYRYVEEKGKFVGYHHISGDSTSVSSNEIHFMTDDDLGRMWVGTDNGLNLYDSKKDIFQNNNDEINLPSISGYAKASDGKMWFTTYSGGGLALVGPDVNDVTMFGEEKGLLHNDDTSGEEIAIDNFGKLWLPTSRGLSVFDSKSQKFTSYFKEDGYQKPYSDKISIKTKNGDIWIGGDNGLNHIIPSDLIKKDSTLPEVLITSMGIMDSLYSKPDGSIFKQAVSYTKEIELQHWQKDIGFEFVALHFLRSEDNQYSWKLENYDKQWTVPSKNRSVAYTNLSPGTYTFHVKASNADKVWNNEGASIKITILPPWWKTWWAYLLYSVLFLMGVWLIHKNQKARTIRREREKSKDKELKQAKEIEKAYTDLKATQSQLIQSEKMASLGELTAGIAHEIQNPLNFVNNFSEVSNELIDEMNAELDKGDIKEAKEISYDLKLNLDKINHHGKRADAIVKGMLQHSRASNGSKEPTDINALTDEYLRLAYHGLRAKDKSFNATLKTDFDESIGKIDIIPQDIGRVILNLITNAFYAVNERKKKTDEGFEPTVSIITKKVNDTLEIKVTDNGFGIPSEIKDKIFQPFFTSKPTGQGTGLGLSLSYDIVRAHGGEIKVETKTAGPNDELARSTGTTFTIILPLGQSS